MSNPWLKKNPFMSIWLSSANRMAGPLRAQATAQVKRQMNTAVADATRESLRLWSDALSPKIKASKPKRKR
jgi:hypothetical protein